MKTADQTFIDFCDKRLNEDLDDKDYYMAGYTDALTKAAAICREKRMTVDVSEVEAAAEAIESFRDSLNK